MKNVQVAQLKAKLSEYLRIVRRGHTLTVRDRETPIARIEPYRDDALSLAVRHPLRMAPKPCRIPLPAPLKLKVEVDVVALLLEERQGNR